VSAATERMAPSVVRALRLLHEQPNVTELLRAGTAMALQVEARLQACRHDRAEPCGVCLRSIDAVYHWVVATHGVREHDDVDLARGPWPLVAPEQLHPVLAEVLDRGPALLGALADRADACTCPDADCEACAEGDRIMTDWRRAVWRLKRGAK